MKLSECPVKVTVDVLSGKWKPLILFSLKDGPRRYGELRRRVSEPSEKVLLQQLRQLESDGIVDRLMTPGKPPHVSYRFTTYGETLNAILGKMAAWGETHRKRRARSITPA